MRLGRRDDLMIVPYGVVRIGGVGADHQIGPRAANGRPYNNIDG